MPKQFAIICVLLLVLSATALAQNPRGSPREQQALGSSLPQFQDAPVTAIFVGPNAKPKLSTAEAREFRTRLAEAASEKPNFAGHYIVVQWGCGTSCLSGAVLDASSGQVTFFPFVYVCCWREVNADFKAINFRANSRLIVFSGQLHEEGEIGTHYFIFENRRFDLLKSIPLGADGFKVPQ